MHQSFVLEGCHLLEFAGAPELFTVTASPIGAPATLATPTAIPKVCPTPSLPVCVALPPGTLQTALVHVGSCGNEHNGTGAICATKSCNTVGLTYPVQPSCCSAATQLLQRCRCQFPSYASHSPATCQRLQRPVGQPPHTLHSKSRSPR